MKKQLNPDDMYEPFEPDDAEYVIKPQVFGAKSKFMEVDSGNTLSKVDGRYQDVPGDFVSLRATGYWYLIHGMLRELRMSNRDRFILEAHVEGKTGRQINNALKKHDYFKPYKRDDYINRQIQRLIRTYWLTPKSKLNSVF